MKILAFFTLISLISMSFSKCVKDKNDESPADPFTPGKKRFAFMVDGIERECYIHVPQQYNSKDQLPVVIMLHGSGGNGEKFYNISGWKELGDVEHILTVFPSSPQYPCVYDDGVKKRNAEKWSSYELELCDGGTPVNDVRFLSQVIDEVKGKYHVDEKRIYIVGFSNGGEMASRTAIELSDKIAAVVACAGALPVDTTFIPVRKLPVLLQIGNSDDRILAKLGATNPLPMDINQLFLNFPGVQKVTNAFLNAFALDTTYSTGGNSNSFVYADYTSGLAKGNNIFRFMLVKDLGHNYPNGKNHPMKAAEIHWEWMKNYQMP